MNNKIMDFINLDRLEDRINYYINNEELHDSKVLDFGADSKKEIFKVKDFDNIYIVPLARYDSLYYHNVEFIDLELICCKFAYLDLNIIENINYYIKGSKIQFSDEFLECMNYLKKNFILDVTPSVIERVSNNPNRRLFSQSIDSYLKFKKSDVFDEHTSAIKLDKYDLEEKATMIHVNKKYSNDKVLIKQYNFIYCMILKAYLLYQDRTLDKKNKIRKLIEFCDLNLNLIAIEELYALCLYLDKGHSNKVFGKLGAPKSKILKNVANIAWDFINNRLAEQRGVFQDDDLIKLPYIVTMDKGMRDYINLNSRKFITYMNGAYFPVFEKNIGEIRDEFGIDEAYIEYIYSLNRTNERKSNLKNVDIQKIRSDLENEFSNI